MFKFLLFLLSLSSFSLCLDPSSPSYNAQLYHMEGPGLNPGQVILPCRYFFVEKDVEDATNASRELQVSIEGENAENKGKCRAWVEVFDTPQLSYIVRYKFHSSCDKVVLRVTLGGHHIQGSPRLGKAPYISFFDFFNYKYQLNIDGTVAAYRFPYLLAGSGVVFKQESQYYEHFYRDLKPYEHYLPINKNIRDLPEKVEAAKESDHETKLISMNGQKFAKHHLTPLNILCYHAQLLDRWAQKMGTHVQIGEGMERVSLEDTEKRYKPSCDCVRFYEHQKTFFSKDEL